MGNLFTENSKVKGKTATQIFPQIIWTNIIGRLTINDVYKSICLVSKELKAVGEAVLKNKDRLAITRSGDTIIQCFDSSHFITDKDFLTLDKSLRLSNDITNILGLMMSSLRILVFSMPNVTNLGVIMKAFPNVVCLVANECIWYYPYHLWYYPYHLWYYPDHLFPKIEHLVIKQGEHLDKIVPSLQSLNIWSSVYYEIDKIPDSCKRLITLFKHSSSLNGPSLIRHERLPRSLEILDVEKISFEGYQRQWRPSFRRLKDIAISNEVISTESFIDFIRDHKRTLERVKLTLHRFSEEALTQILLEISDIKKVVVYIELYTPNRPDIVKKLKVLSTVLIGEAKNLFLEIDLDNSCYSVIDCFLENLPTSTASAVFTLNLWVGDNQKQFICDHVCQAMVNSGYRNAFLKIIFLGKDKDVFEERLLSKFQELEVMSVYHHTHPFLEIRVKNN